MLTLALFWHILFNNPDPQIEQTRTELSFSTQKTLPRTEYYRNRLRGAAPVMWRAARTTMTGLPLTSG